MTRDACQFGMLVHHDSGAVSVAFAGVLRVVECPAKWGVRGTLLGFGFACSSQIGQAPQSCGAVMDGSRFQHRTCMVGARLGGGLHHVGVRWPAVEVFVTVIDDVCAWPPRTWAS